MSGFLDFSFGNKTKSHRRRSSRTKKRHGPFPTTRTHHHSHSIRFTPHHKKPVFPSKNRQLVSYIPPNKLYLGNKEVLYSYDLWIDVNKESKTNESIMNLLNYIYYYYFMKPLLPKNYLHKNVYDIELLFNNTFGFDSPISTDRFKKVKRHGTFDKFTFNKTLTLGVRTFYKLLFFHYIGNIKMELIVDNNGVEMSIPIATDTTILLEKGLKYKLKVHHNTGSNKFKLTVLDLLI